MLLLHTSQRSLEGGLKKKIAFNAACTIAGTACSRLGRVSLSRKGHASPRTTIIRYTNDDYCLQLQSGRPSAAVPQSHPLERQCRARIRICISVGNRLLLLLPQLAPGGI